MSMTYVASGTRRQAAFRWGHRFHVGGQRAEGGLRELRAVARGYAGLDPRAFGQAVDEIGKVRQEPRQRIALIAFIP